MNSISIEEVRRFLKSGVFELKPTQKRLCFPIIQRIYHKMNIGVPFENINVEAELLINGHHRYICSLLSKKNINKSPWQSSRDIKIYKWTEVEIDANDWESQDLIERHNQSDASKSGLNIKDFEL